MKLYRDQYKGCYLYFYENIQHVIWTYPQQPAHSRPGKESCSKVKMSTVQLSPEINNLVWLIRTSFQIVDALIYVKQVLIFLVTTPDD